MKTKTKRLTKRQGKMRAADFDELVRRANVINAKGRAKVINVKGPDWDATWVFMPDAERFQCRAQLALQFLMFDAQVRDAADFNGMDLDAAIHEADWFLQKLRGV